MVDAQPSQANYRFTARGLQPGHTYNFIVASDRAVNGSVWGKAASLVVTTAQPVCQTPPGSPSNLAARATSYSSVALTWAPPTGPCPVNGYIITYYPAGSSGAAQSQTVHDEAATLQGLQPGTTYSIAVAAFNQFGAGDSRGATTLVSLPSPPPPPCTLPPGPVNSLSASPISSTSAQVSWNAPTQGCGSSDVSYYTYTVQQLSSGMGASRGSQQQQYRVPDVTVAINSLQPGASYRITVNAVNGNGASRDSSVTLTMPPPPCNTPPGGVSGLASQQAGATSASLSWNAPRDGSCGNAQIDYYTYQVSQNGGLMTGSNSQSQRTSQFNVVVSSLTPGEWSARRAAPTSSWPCHTCLT